MTSTEPTTIRVRRDRVLGEVSPLLYGQFTEHLVNIVYDGLWSEMLFGRKFEAPMTHRARAEIAAPWRSFGANDEHTSYPRGAAPLPRYASPQAQAHHAQAVVVQPGRVSGECGLAQDDVVIDAGTSYVFRGSVRRVGGDGVLRVALRSGSAVLAEAMVTVPPVTSTRFGPQPSWNHLWMDDQSWHEIETTLTPEAGDAHGALTLTFESRDDELSAWWFDWVSLMPADNMGGWHSGVVAELRDLPVQMLKWPGGCMSDDYDWRFGIGPRDRRYGSVDQAWAAWDENDVGTDEFIELCRMTKAEPVLGVNAGTGSPELAAAWVQYCNGPVTTDWGRVRAANGHPEPYGIRYWAVGNEQWGYFERGYVGAEEYAERYTNIAVAMRAADPTITLAAVGHPGEFTRTVLRRCARDIDLLQIHFYTAEEAEVTDLSSASAKVISARAFDDVFGQIRDDLASVEDTDHIRVCLDEWGWARAGHAGAVFVAAALNAMHRATPLVALGARSAVINVDGVVDREGATVRRTPLYDVFGLYGACHHPLSIGVETSGPKAGVIDASALLDPDDQTLTLYVVNAASDCTDVAIDVEADSVTVHQVGIGTEGPAGPSTVQTRTERWTPARTLPPVSLTVLELS